jgi:hypothetical protein
MIIERKWKLEEKRPLGYSPEGAEQGFYTDRAQAKIGTPVKNSKPPHRSLVLPRGEANQIMEIYTLDRTIPRLY